MTILIHAIGPDVIAYPATLDALRQEFPNCSFPIEPTAEDLAPFNRFPVTPIPAPSCDPRTERTEHQPTLTENGWQQAWTIRPATDEEIAAYDLAHQPEPDWMAFGIDLAINPEISNLYDMVPTAIANGLSIGLNEASKGDPRLFMGLWKKIMETGAISTELLHTIASLAVQHHLPKEFIMGLSGTISAPNEVEVAPSTDIVASVDSTPIAVGSSEPVTQIHDGMVSNGTIDTIDVDTISIAGGPVQFIGAGVETDSINISSDSVSLSQSNGLITEGSTTDIISVTNGTNSDNSAEIFD